MKKLITFGLNLHSKHIFNNIILMLHTTKTEKIKYKFLIGLETNQMFFTFKTQWIVVSLKISTKNYDILI